MICYEEYKKKIHSICIELKKRKNGQINESHGVVMKMFTGK